MNIVRKIIRANGTEESFDAPRKMPDLCKAIGAGLIDTVQLRHMGLPVHVMLFDDGGHDAGKPVNVEATRLYHLNCRPGTTHQIVGDVVVCPDDDFGGPF